MVAKIDMVSSLLRVKVWNGLIDKFKTKRQISNTKTTKAY